MLELFGAIFPVVSDMPIDSDALVVILSISGEYVCMYVSICIYTVFRKKNYTHDTKTKKKGEK